ncbi:hypothetical protein GGS21DRAFT_18455 [Xylaria nigripes]|nr:hypothetical protein GGS21DRAFT_18455 [Xylaria nigripes]
MVQTQQYRLPNRRPITLDGYFDSYISAPRDGRLFDYYGISACTDNFSSEEEELMINWNWLWTCVDIGVDRKVDEREAKRILREVDEGLAMELWLQHKPKRIAYRFHNESNTVYLAKSYRVRGELSPPRPRRRYYGGENDTDWQPTRPATPEELGVIKYKVLDL